MLFSFTPKLDMYVSWPFFKFIFLSQISYQNISIHRLLMFFVCCFLGEEFACFVFSSDVVCKNGCMLFSEIPQLLC